MLSYIVSVSVLQVYQEEYQEECQGEYQGEYQEECQEEYQGEYLVVYQVVHPLEYQGLVDTHQQPKLLNMVWCLKWSIIHKYRSTLNIVYNYGLYLPPSHS